MSQSLEGDSRVAYAYSHSMVYEWLSSEAVKVVRRKGHVRVPEVASPRAAARSLCSLSPTASSPCSFPARPTATSMPNDSSGDEFGTYLSPAVTRPRTSEYG